VQSVHFCFISRSAWTLYIEISEGYTAEPDIEKKFLISSKKRNLLLRKRLADQNQNKEVSNE